MTRYTLKYRLLQKLYVSMQAKPSLAQPLKFIARASTMGDKKLVIYVPIEFREEILKRWGKHQIKVTLEDAV